MFDANIVGDIEAGTGPGRRIQLRPKASKPMKMPMIPPDCEGRRMELPPFIIVRSRAEECSPDRYRKRTLTSGLFSRCTVSVKPHTGRVGGHHDGLRAGAIAEETHALPAELPSVTPLAAKYDVAARRQLLGGVNLVDVADAHGLHPLRLLLRPSRPAGPGSRHSGSAAPPR